MNEGVVLARVRLKYFTPVLNCFSEAFYPLLFIKTGCEDIENLVEFFRSLRYRQKPNTYREADSMVKIDERKLFIEAVRDLEQYAADNLTQTYKHKGDFKEA